MSNEICEVVRPVTNWKGRKVADEYDKKMQKILPAYISFSAEGFEAFLMTIIAGGVHMSNKEHIFEMCRTYSLPLYHESTSCHRFKILLSSFR